MARVKLQKLILKGAPCRVPDPCLDYDPCESAEDITDKDLAALLKEEQENERREKEKAEAEQRQLDEEAGKSSEDGATKGKTEAEGGKGAEGKGEEVKGGAGRREGACHRAKKRPCRKPSNNVENPFFTNRLGFSNDLPPPPPAPPPQFFPLVDESEIKVCPKRRKKCKKKEMKECGKKGGKEGEGKGGDGGEGKEGKEGMDREGEEKGGAETVPEDGECNCLYEDECLEEGADSEEVERWKRGKRRCRRAGGERPPCRKRVSEVSISLQQPRHIPALQRELPPTSPKDIPEVERQIMMACGKERKTECIKRKCKKKS